MFEYEKKYELSKDLINEIKNEVIQQLKEEVRPLINKELTNSDPNKKKNDVFTLNDRYKNHYKKEYVDVIQNLLDQTKIEYAIKNKILIQKEIELIDVKIIYLKQKIKEIDQLQLDDDSQKLKIVAISHFNVLLARALDDKKDLIDQLYE